MSILAAFMVPHPPMIVPAVGRGSEAQILETTKAYEQVADEIARLAPETIIITSPHAVMYSDYFHISPGKGAKGSFGQFGALKAAFEEQYDTGLVQEICAIAERKGFPAGTLGERDKRLDHGTMVPLWFIRQKYSGGRIVRIGISGLPLTDHYLFGEMIREAVGNLGRRAVFVASGDLSHKLQSYGPYGFAPEGPQYDARIMDVCGRGAFGELFDFDETFCERAAECGHRSFVIMAGALDGVPVEARQLSHQDVTGVGYGICTFYPVESGAPDAAASAEAGTGREAPEAGAGREAPGAGEGGEAPAAADRHFLKQYLNRIEAENEEKKERSDAYVRLARASLEEYILHRRVIPVPEDLPEEMRSTRAGAFVSLHKHGKLRGCIGTILPTTGCVAQEIIRNAISASTQDPRFDPVRPDEVKWLEISVDVLGEPEEIASESELDVKRYGVIVSCGHRKGLLLPDLEGVDTVEEQVRIARQKGGIRPGEKVKLQRFEVIRHV